MSAPSPDDIIKYRLENGLNQIQAAHMVCVKVTTWRAWEYGQNPMPPGYWKLFMLLLTLEMR